MRDDGYPDEEAVSPRPLLKWAGGKGKLIPEFCQRLPPGLPEGRIERFIEPFVGGGAFYFHLAHRYPSLQCHLFDINEELILLYTVLQQDVEALIQELQERASGYSSSDEDGRPELFYHVRSRYNASKPSIDYQTYSADWVARAADLIFLNRTCFNGLFRVNSRGEFNVPFGKYKNPAILSEGILRADAALLRKATLHHGDFTASGAYITEGSFVYFDPPYRPLNASSLFTGYAKDGFSDNDQIRLAEFFRECDAKGAFCMLSNSDPTNHDPDDTFFDDLYEGFTIERVLASRFINSDATRRGKIHEILVRNY